MGVKVLLYGFHHLFHLDVIRNLVKCNNWEPRYWIGGLEHEKEIKKRYPKAIFHDSFSAVLGIPPDGFCELELRALDQPLLEDLAYYEAIVLKMMDKMDPYKIFAYNERLQLYYLQLKYWLSILEKLNIRIVIFESVPHEVSSYIIYILARWKGLRTITFNVTAFRHLVVPLDNYEDDFPAVVLYKELLAKGNYGHVSLSLATEETLKKTRLPDYDNALPFSTIMLFDTFNKRDVTNRTCAQTVFEFYRDIRRILGSIRQPPRQNYVKRKRKTFQASRLLPRYKHELYKFRFKLKKRKMAFYYKSMAQTLDLKAKYVYVPLHYQPELTTSPLGGSFVCQDLMVELLSKAIPEGWLLYVKEHFSQFVERSQGECCRSLEYYDNIASLPNVKLASLSQSTFALIDNALAVANVGGTAGFEAVVRGTPVITFGHAWYNGCEGVYYTPSYEECKRVLNEIEKG